MPVPYTAAQFEMDMMDIWLVMAFRLTVWILGMVYSFQLLHTQTITFYALILCQIDYLDMMAHVGSRPKMLLE